MAAHTPGPWEIEKDHDDVEGTVLIHGAADAPGLVIVALVYTADAFLCIDDEERAEAEAEYRANARLIAAAPDLLAVLEGLLASFENYASINLPQDEWDEYDHMMFPRWAAARAAIAKAKGDS